MKLGSVSGYHASAGVFGASYIRRLGEADESKHSNDKQRQFLIRHDNLMKFFADSCGVEGLTRVH